MKSLVSKILGVGWMVAVALPLVACGSAGGDGGGSSGNGDGDDTNSDPPFIALITGQDASVVIGQENFDDSFSGNQPDELNGPMVDAFVHQGTLFIPDRGNNRVLGFSAIPTENNAAADFAVGQPTLTSVTAGSSASKFQSPASIHISDGRLFIADEANSRVLIFNAIPSASGAWADVVVGQPNLTANSTECSDDGMTSPRGVVAVDGKLIVADTFNHRVLIWNSIPNSDGQAADLVLGQPDFDTCTGAPPTASSTNTPRTVWSDGERLVVGDSQNNRVLIWEQFPTASAQPADVVVGQPNFTTITQGLSDSKLDLPHASSNGTQLFVGDDDNNRVLIWNSFPTMDGEAADVVLGQDDFDTGASGRSVNEFSGPTGVYPSGNRLFVSDTLNTRVLIFEGG